MGLEQMYGSASDAHIATADISISDFVSPANVNVVCDDILSQTSEWTCHDVAFAAATCFSPTLIAGIVKRARRMHPGSILIVAGWLGEEAHCVLNESSSPFKHLNRGNQRFINWGSVLVHFLIRLPDSSDDQFQPPPRQGGITVLKLSS